MVLALGNRMVLDGHPNAVCVGIVLVPEIYKRARTLHFAERNRCCVSGAHHFVVVKRRVTGAELIKAEYRCGKR